VTTEEKAEEQEAEKKTNGDIEKALKKGSIQLAPSKDEKMTSQFDSLKTSLKGGRKQKKNRDGGQDGTIDFALIKKFNNLKIKPPINDEDYEKTISDLNELRDALIYWGKIISRQNKIKFIRTLERFLPLMSISPKLKKKRNTSTMRNLSLILMKLPKKLISLLIN